MKIMIIVGSESDLKQCHDGLVYLDSTDAEVEVYIRSQHRNTIALQKLLQEKAVDVDVIIAGAGWANHLTGCVDAFLRYELKVLTPVIGVAFEDEKNSRHTNAAILSMTEVPGTQVIFGSELTPFVGPIGFKNACRLAYLEQFPTIELKSPRPPLDLTLAEAIERAK